MKKTCILALCLLLFAVPAKAQFSDMPNDWSTESLQHAVDNGLLSGYDGKINPTDNMTRAQMAAVMARAFGATQQASLTRYSDISEDDWFYADMAKAVSMGAFKGTGDQLNPESPITREETFLVLARLFSLADGEASDLSGFLDAQSVSSWAVGGVSAIVNSGYVKGTDGKLNPQSYITRAEFASVIDRMLPNFIDQPGTYTSLPEGNVMIRTSGVTLENVTTANDVIIGDGVDGAGVSINNGNLTGRTLIRGGGDKVVITGSFNQVLIAMPGLDVYAVDAKIGSLGVCKDSNIFIGTSNSAVGE